MKNTKNNSKKFNRKILAILIFLIGLMIFLYPSISNWLADCNQTRVVNNYIKHIENLTEEDLKEKAELAQKYNEELLSTTVEENGISYMDFLHPGEVLGYIEIEKINVNLPIYQGVTDDILRVGVGHLEKSSLPTSKSTTHVMLTAHTGLPTSNLFTDLDKIEINDEFSVTSLNKKYTYKVDQIKIVLPEDASELKIIEEKSYATLITCTPYMINTHRLLVRGQLSSVEDITQIEEENANTESNIENIEQKESGIIKILLREIEYIDLAMCIYYLIHVMILAIILKFTFLKEKNKIEEQSKDKIEKETIKDDTKIETVKTEKPKSEKPKSEKPKSEKPKSEKPKPEKTKPEKPKPEKPKPEKPKSEKPKSEKPKPEKPKPEKPKPEKPKPEKPKTEKNKNDKN